MEADTEAQPSIQSLVSHAQARSSGKHASGDVHRHELLEEQLGGVRDLNLRDARLVVARPAFVGALLDLPGSC